LASYWLAENGRLGSKINHNHNPILPKLPVLKPEISSLKRVEACLFCTECLTSKPKNKLCCIAHTMEIAGQLNATERRLITEAILGAAKKPNIALEVGTWLGGGSTLHILRALEQNCAGHLWGIEADRSIYEHMLANIRAADPEAAQRFTPIFGFSQDVLKQWKKEQPDDLLVDFVFLDGGNNPREQIEEFELLDPVIPVGGQLMSHDAKMRKGRWLVPFISRLDNWESQLHDISENGLFYAKKIACKPSPQSLRTAKRNLFRQACHPVEMAASYLPSFICAFALRLLPRKFSRNLSDGKN
jgi:predicted O-methyltransferase YrrM